MGEYSLPFFQLRGYGSTLVTANDIDPINLDANEGNWDSKPSEASEISRGVFNCVANCSVNVARMSAGKIRTIEIIGYGTNDANEDCAWKLYAWRGLYSPVKRVAAGTAILSTMDVVKDPVRNEAITAGYYVDTWGISDYWSTASVTDNADNALSVLTFDLRGYTWLSLEILPTSGTCASFAAAFSGF